MKILAVEKTLDKNFPYKFTALIYGEDYTSTARSIPHMVQKLVHRDMFISPHDVLEDLKLNYPHIFNESSSAPTSVG
jgi:hypothetical protein